MIGLEDRRRLAQSIEVAHAAGARLAAACEVAGISVRTLQRWIAHQGLETGDGRPDASGVTRNCNLLCATTSLRRT